MVKMKKRKKDTVKYLYGINVESNEFLVPEKFVRLFEDFGYEVVKPPKSNKRGGNDNRRHNKSD